jgi:hypothetical protein
MMKMMIVMRPRRLAVRVRANRTSGRDQPAPPRRHWKTKPLGLCVSTAESDSDADADTDTDDDTDQDTDSNSEKDLDATIDGAHREQIQALKAQKAGAQRQLVHEFDELMAMIAALGNGCTRRQPTPPMLPLPPAQQEQEEQEQEEQEEVVVEEQAQQSTLIDVDRQEVTTTDHLLNEIAARDQSLAECNEVMLLMDERVQAAEAERDQMYERIGDLERERESLGAYANKLVNDLQTAKRRRVWTLRDHERELHAIREECSTLRNEMTAAKAAEKKSVEAAEAALASAAIDTAGLNDTIGCLRADIVALQCALDEAHDKLAQETAARARTEALAVGLARTAESLMIQQAAAQADAASKAGEATSASIAKRRTQETTEKLSTAGVRASRTAKNERPPWR